MSSFFNPEQNERIAQASDVFRRSWSMYEKVVDGNGMRHREMERTLHLLLIEIVRPFSLLDLGCGDASMASRALVGTAVRSYTGVEVVETLTARAEQRLAGIVPQCTFLNGNLIDAVRRPFSSPFDVVLASYSVHHLSLAEKARLFRDVHAQLAAAGTFILIDLMLRDGENRRGFLDRFHTLAPKTLSMLNDEERQEVKQHIEASDWPESLETYQELATDAGFRSAHVQYRDPNEFYALLWFR